MDGHRSATGRIAEEAVIQLMPPLSAPPYLSWTMMKRYEKPCRVCCVRLAWPWPFLRHPGNFLRSTDPATPGCLVLDITMPDFDGLQLQTALTEKGSMLPIIFLTGHGDVSKSVQAMKQWRV